MWIGYSTQVKLTPPEDQFRNVDCHSHHISAAKRRTDRVLSRFSHDSHQGRSSSAPVHKSLVDFFCLAGSNPGSMPNCIILYSKRLMQSIYPQAQQNQVSYLSVSYAVRRVPFLLQMLLDAVLEYETFYFSPKQSSVISLFKVMCISRPSTLLRRCLPMSLHGSLILSVDELSKCKLINSQ